MIHGARSRRRTLLTIFIMVACGAILGAALAAAPAGAIRTNEQYGFMNQIGGPGSGIGQFGSGSNPGPYGVAVDAAGNVFVVDPHNSGDRIHKFTPSGAHICSFGPYGTDQGGLSSPYGIAVAPNGTVFVADTWRNANNDRIQYFTSPDGGSTYVSAGQIAIAPNSGESFNIAADGTGHAYVTDSAGGRVLKYRVADDVLVATIGTTGSGDNLLTFPKGIAVSADGLDLYVSDATYVKRFHSPDNGTTYSVAQIYGQPGSSYDLSGPWGVTFDGGSNVFVVDATNAIVKFNAAGGLVESWGSTGPGDYEFRGARAVAVSTNGCVYVTDEGSNDPAHTEYAGQNHRVMRYARDLTPPVSIVNGLPPGWTNAAAISLSFSGTDPVAPNQFTSGCNETELFLDGIWTAFFGDYVVTAEGITPVQYRSGDYRGNLETIQQLEVRIDRTRPAIENPHAGVPAGWSKRPVTVTFLASDALSLVARTEYSTDGGGTWTPGASATVSRSGTTTLLYRAVDNAGNVSDAVADTIKVDRIKPTPKPLANVMVKRGKTATLRYRVNDGACPQATAVIKIKKGSKVVKTISLGKKATGRDLVYSWKCSITKGAYTWTVLATDLAGNKQAKTVTKKLTVK